MVDCADAGDPPSATSVTGHLRAGTDLGGLRLSDGVVVLDRLRLSDAEEHLRGEDAELQRWLSGGKSTLDGVVAYLHRVEQAWTERGPVFHFAIRVEPHHALAGTMDVQFDQPYATSGQVNLAYGVYPQWRRRGFAVRAVELAVRFLRDHTDARSALIRVDPANPASAGVAGRAGFTVVPGVDDHVGMVRFERVLHARPDDG